MLPSTTEPLFTLDCLMLRALKIVFRELWAHKASSDTRMVSIWVTRGGLVRQAKCLIAAANQGAKSQEWLGERVLDFACPQKRIGLKSTSYGGWSTGIRRSDAEDREIGTLHWPTVVKARQMAVETVAEGQKQNGRDWIDTKEGLDWLQDTWSSRFLRSEVAEWGIPATAGLMQLRKAATDKPCQQRCTLASHLCSGHAKDIHPADKIFQCQDMRGSVCLIHVEHTNFYSTPKDTSWLDDTVQYDARRGIVTKPSAIGDAEANAASTVFGGMQPADWPIDEVTAILRSVHSRDDRISKLVTVAPAVVCREAFTARPTPTSLDEPLADICRRAFAGHTFSLDLWRHFAEWDHGNSSVQGHQLLACSKIPCWLQSVKRTRHPIVVALYIAAIHVQSIPLAAECKHAIMERLASLLESLSELNRRYCRAPVERTLSNDLAQLSRECMGLLFRQSSSQPPIEIPSWKARCDKSRYSCHGKHLPIPGASYNQDP
ncbi:unnamed protein product [Sympodiomycopsis kandeliae]